MSLCETLLLYAMVSGLTTVLSQHIYPCEREKNCTIQINETTAYDCVVGHHNACYSIPSTGQPPPPGNPQLYPYLTTIGIDKRIFSLPLIDYLSTFLHFSFKLPLTSFGVGGSALGIMAQFKEAPGYLSNQYYAAPICRFFNFSSSDFIGPDFIAKEKLTIPYSCIGIGISPSVFILQLTTIPSNYALDYVINWNNDGGEMYNWKERIVAVATIKEEMCIHVVFDPPKAPNDFVVNASLRDRHDKVVKTTLLIGRENEATFRNVSWGSYWVTLELLCENEEIDCPMLRSEEILMNSGIEDSETDTFPEVAPATFAGIAFVLLVVIIFITTWMLQKHNKLRNSQKATSILVISQASRELEKKITLHFCSFLGRLFETEVVNEFHEKYGHDPQNLTTTDENSRSSLLRRVGGGEGKHLCTIHLIFSYSASGIYQETVSDDCLTLRNGNRFEPLPVWGEPVFKDQSQTSRKTSFKNKRKNKKRSPGFNTVVALFTNDQIACKSIGPFSDALSNDEQVTVFTERFIPSTSPPHDAQSMCNRPALCPVLANGHYANVYYLPGQMTSLCLELCDTLPKEKKIRLDDNAILSSEHWIVITELHAKASENQPEEDALRAWICQYPDLLNSTFTLDFTQQEQTAASSIPRLSVCDEVKMSDDDSFSNVSIAERQLGGSDWGGSLERPVSAGICPSCSLDCQLHGSENATGSCPNIPTSDISSNLPNIEPSHIPADFVAQIIPPTF